MIDLHAHLDLYPDPKEVVRDCVARNMYVLSVTTTPSAWEGTCALASGAGRIRTALGLHPEIAHERKGELGLFEQLLPQTQYVGEVGLDGSPHLRLHQFDQSNVLGHILSRCAQAGGKVLSLHSRRAVEPVLDALKKEPNAGAPVLHWFSGTRQQLQRAADQGCWFSVGPAMLAGAKGRALVSYMPKDRVLTESDGPFAIMNGSRLWPRDVAAAVTQLSAIWQTPEYEVEGRLARNLSVLAGLFSERTDTTQDLGCGG